MGGDTCNKGSECFPEARSEQVTTGRSKTKKKKYVLLFFLYIISSLMDAINPYAQKPQSPLKTGGVLGHCMLMEFNLQNLVGLPRVSRL